MATSKSPLFLGLDLSTQQLKAIITSKDSVVVHESAVYFDQDLSTYGTVNGAIHGPGGEVTSPVCMWLEAMDLLMEKMKTVGVDFKAVVAISGAGQVSGQ
jgi:xylulokinase